MDWLPKHGHDYQAYKNTFPLLLLVVPTIATVSTLIFYYILHHVISIGGNKKLQWWLLLLGTATVITVVSVNLIRREAFKKLDYDIDFGPYLAWFCVGLFLISAVLFWLLSLLLKSRSDQARPIPTQKGLHW
jgi:magnesium-transporting ATPase (P-type)